MRSICWLVVVAVCLGSSGAPWETGAFRWLSTQPLLAAEDRDGDKYMSLKDPTVVRHDGRWHLFCTIRGKQRSHQLEYLSFTDWASVATARRTTLKLTAGYFCAPQVFYFRPHKKWYLIYQIVDKSREPSLQPAFSTSSDISDPASWTPPRFLMDDPSNGIKSWIDFWVICDRSFAHLFFTTLDGRMWRSETTLQKFPAGWSRPAVALKDDIYEASHTYRIKGRDQYVTLVEAQGQGGRRYFKAYQADRLDGRWNPLAASGARSFATPDNVRFNGDAWSDSFSHGELIRDGRDETLTVNPSGLQFLYQGVLDRDRQGKIYGEIPWRLGLLRLE